MRRSGRVVYEYGVLGQTTIQNSELICKLPHLRTREIITDDISSNMKKFGETGERGIIEYGGSERDIFLSGSKVEMGNFGGLFKYMVSSAAS